MVIVESFVVRTSSSLSTLADFFTSFGDSLSSPEVPLTLLLVIYVVDILALLVKASSPIVLDKKDAVWNQPYIWRIAGLVVRPQLLISDSALTLFILGFHTYPSLSLHFLIGTGGKYFIPIPQNYARFIYIHA